MGVCSRESFFSSPRKRRCLAHPTLLPLHALPPSNPPPRAHKTPPRRSHSLFSPGTHVFLPKHKRPVPKVGIVEDERLGKYRWQERKKGYRRKGGGGGRERSQCECFVMDKGSFLLTRRRWLTGKRPLGGNTSSSVVSYLLLL